MATLLKLTLMTRNGTFNTVQANLEGAAKTKIVAESVLGLLRIDSPLITKTAKAELLRRASLSRTRNSNRAELEIGSEYRVVTAGTIDALTNLMGADAIAGLAADDNRRQPLKKINRALAMRDMCLDVEIDGVALPRIDRLALAPHARVDVAWDGEIIVRVTSWNTELTVIEGRSEKQEKVKIDLHQHPHRFNELMQQAAPFVRVNGGHGRVNPSGLRILQHDSLERLDHNDLPAALQLHFAGGSSTPREVPE